jgi:hypothetical protein
MKKIVLFTLTTIFFSSLKSQTIDVLFVGSSYTYFNNMPQMLVDIANSKADTVYFETNEQSGTDFEFFTTDTVVLEKINQRAWDYVVLQERSILPALDTLSVQENVYPFAKKLDSLILANNNCSETVFFMTWGKENGDSSYCTNYPPVCTYNGMQQRLRESYLEMTASNHATISPVGIVWKNIRELYPNINLYSDDESRPSLQGSYLAACTFYSTLFHKSCLGASHPVDISNEDALALQTVSSNIVLDSLFLWQGHGDIANPNFNFEINDNEVQFTNLSFNTLEYFWNFGDNSTSSEINPLHIYADYEGYNVTLTASNNCSSFKAKNTCFLIASDIHDNSNNSNIQVFPNPSKGNFTILTNFNSHFKIRIFNPSGQEVFTEIIPSDNSINLFYLPKGFYQMLLQNNNTTIIKKITIQ